MKFLPVATIVDRNFLSYLTESKYVFILGNGQKHSNKEKTTGVCRAIDRDYSIKVYPVASALHVRLARRQAIRLLFRGIHPPKALRHRGGWRNRLHRGPRQGLLRQRQIRSVRIFVG